MNFVEFLNFIIWLILNKGFFIVFEFWFGLLIFFEEGDYLEDKKNVCFLEFG